MQSPLAALAGNRALWAAFTAWFVAQSLKTFFAFVRSRKFNASFLVASGGMPSSHSALVVGLATGVARVSGLGSPLFALAAVFASVVMYDAAGVRLAVSRQARILNLMIDDFFHDRGFNEHRMRELIGHTPIEVFVGALLGILFGLLWTA